MILERLRSWRESAGLTQIELAEVAGVTPFTVSRAEKGGSLRVTSAKKLADALAVNVANLQGEPPVPAPKGSALGGTGPLAEMLERLGTRTRHLADADLVTDLETASDAAVSRAVREIRAELAVLVPELRRLRDGVKPGDADFMPVNRALADSTRQVFVLNMFLRHRDGQEPQAVALADAGRELHELAVA